MFSSSILTIDCYITGTLLIFLRTFIQVVAFIVDHGIFLHILTCLLAQSLMMNLSLVLVLTTTTSYLMVKCCPSITLLLIPFQFFCFCCWPFSLMVLQYMAEAQLSDLLQEQLCLLSSSNRADHNASVLIFSSLFRHNSFDSFYFSRFPILFTVSKAPWKRRYGIPTDCTHYYFVFTNFWPFLMNNSLFVQFQTRH